MENIVDLELAKRLKYEGFHKPTEYYYQDKDLPYSDKGLKRNKHGKKINNNKYDDFIYSAPTIKEGVEYLHGKNIKYESTLPIKLEDKQI